MKRDFLLLLFLGLTAIVTGCQPAVDEEIKSEGPFVVVRPYFNEVNTRFSDGEINCLLANWYEGIYRDEKPVVFRVINDDSTYRAFFNCQDGVSLRPIDFSAKTLLVGMNAGSGTGNDAPIKIKGMKQVMFRKGDEYTLRVMVKGKKREPGGGEWFGFTSLVSKTDRNVTLEMQFQYE